MADLLIKGIEMTDSPITLVLYPNGDIDHLTEDNRYETIAKAVEVKPHGRLIDADELEASDAIDVGKEAWDMVHNAPTVLEASEWLNV